MKIAPNVICVTRGLVLDAECNDMLVEVITHLPGGAVWRAPDGTTWRDRDDNDTWVTVSLGRPFPESSTAVRSMYSIFLPRNLRPIRPDETPEESTEAMRRLHDTTVKQGEPVS